MQRFDHSVVIIIIYLITGNSHAMWYLTGRRHMATAGYKMDTDLFFASVGLTYEQSAVKLVVGVLKSGTALYKTHAHISLLNVTYVCSCLFIYSI